MKVRPGRGAACVGIAAVVLTSWLSVVACSSTGRTQRTENCVYTRDGITGLLTAGRTLGIEPTCALVFAGGVTWASWTRPWFLQDSIRNLAWAAWAGSNPAHRLIITVDLIPVSERSSPDWRRIGAAGGFAQRARLLGERLAAAGLGNSLIRLGNEGNGSWVGDGIGGSPREWVRWRAMWRRTAIAMKSVPGTDFKFIWCVAAGVGDVPLWEYYPGDDVVDYVGFDVYDEGIGDLGGNRWAYLYGRPGGVADIVGFASTHRKPLAIPEWALAPRPAGIGDDPEFVRGIGTLVKTGRLALQGYFYAGSWAAAIAHAPQSLRAYRSAFG